MPQSHDRIKGKWGKKSERKRKGKNAKLRGLISETSRCRLKGWSDVSASFAGKNGKWATGKKCFAGMNPIRHIVTEAFVFMNLCVCVCVAVVWVALSTMREKDQFQM